VAVTRQTLPKLILVGAAVAPALLLLRACLLLRDLAHHDAERATVLPVAACAAVLALVAALPLLALRFAPGHRAELALAAASLAATLGAAELVLGRSPEAFEKRLTERLRAAEAMARPGAPAYALIEPVRLVWARGAEAPASLDVDGVPTLPLAGRARSRLVFCRDEPDGDWRAYDTDEHGFINPVGAWSRAPVSLVAVGDSFTAGSCVPPESSMVAGLRGRYPDAVNLGVPGSGPLMMLSVVREYLPALRPREVLWFHYEGNDLVDLRREKDHPLLRRYLLEAGFRQGLMERQAALDRSLDDYLETHLRPLFERKAHARRSVKDVLALRGLRARFGLVFTDPWADVPTEEEYALMATVLERARETVSGWGGTLRFVYLPAGERAWHVARAAEAAVAAGVRGRTLALVRGLAIPVIDVGAVFAARPDPQALFSCHECHFTTTGYRVAADTVLSGLPVTPAP
jgi:hypothetical protein